MWDSMIRKLGRGVSNVAFGAVEFPVKWYQVNFEEGGFAACTYGIFKGLTYVVIREVVGVVEVANILCSPSRMQHGTARQSRMGLRSDPRT